MNSDWIGADGDHPHPGGAAKNANSCEHAIQSKLDALATGMLEGMREEGDDADGMLERATVSTSRSNSRFADWPACKTDWRMRTHDHIERRRSALARAVTGSEARWRPT